MISEMTFAAPIEAETKQPRARGEIVVSACARDGGSHINRLRQAGCSRALMPRHAGDDLLAVTINTAGGLTGGDRLSVQGEAGEAAHLTLTTQAAERAYRAQPGEMARVAVKLSAAPGGRIDWVPQETILFNHCALARTLDADLAPDATLLAVETTILGRPAMREALNAAHFTDNWRIRRSGELIFADALRLRGDVARAAGSPAMLGGGTAFASICFAAPEAECDRLLDEVRGAIGAFGGASIVRPGVLAARLVAATGFDLRRALIPALTVLRGRPLPPVWSY